MVAGSARPRKRVIEVVITGTWAFLRFFGPFFTYGEVGYLLWELVEAFNITNIARAAITFWAALDSSYSLWEIYSRSWTSFGERVRTGCFILSRTWRLLNPRFSLLADCKALSVGSKFQTLDIVGARPHWCIWTLSRSSRTRAALFWNRADLTVARRVHLLSIWDCQSVDNVLLRRRCHLSRDGLSSRRRSSISVFLDSGWRGRLLRLSSNWLGQR